ncbi:hypothetical protein [Ornithinibacillus halotolerans]|uniref:Uncharacterized protein n=1 Tax=Ornithinibacillus halotolerans TaxID=1274357 RepID=A0A916RS02_9BACI|nr:hypothetical protein [Ornithinibacillus halotolerans]GGA67582.1 hypothetical protein GCM10008025_09270 [Ornithinibacillus halotolerans]
MVGEKKIYLLLTDTGTAFTRLIKSYTKKPYNHASIAFDPNLEEVYSFGRKTPRNPFIGGFVREDINSVLFKRADCAIYSLTVSDEDYQKMNRFIQLIAENKDLYRYNLIGLLGVVVKKPIKRKNAFFCSQFVGSVLKESENINFEKDVALIQPNDLLRSANFELIYEGRLVEYQHDMPKERVHSYPVISI